ncbi:MAG: ABC-type uncharacterized transport system substrate-binding protein [Oleispira sp.]|jgi:ABC-type uncharacterized transport system substrate-binding protein
MFIARLLLILLTFFSALVSAEDVILVAENNTPVLKKLIRGLSQLAPDFSYQISTAKTPITIPKDAYVISVGAKQSSHVDYSQYPKRIAVMLTAKQAEISDMATSIYIEPPLSRQLQLADLLVPGDKKIGLLVSNKQDKEDVFKTLTDAERMMLKVVSIEDYDNINQALFHVLKGTRLLLGHYNNDIYNAQNIKNILITSYRQRKVLIGPSRAYLKAGSFSTTFSDLSHIARRITEIVIHHKGTGQWLKADYNPHYRILFNPQVARSLNIRILNDDVLMQQMGGR